jgi:hypothetical protein
MKQPPSSLRRLKIVTYQTQMTACLNYLHVQSAIDCAQSHHQLFSHYSSGRGPDQLRSSKLHIENIPS